METKKNPTLSDKIRELYRQGKSISEIAKALGIRYQHAYNVLVQSGLYEPKKKGKLSLEEYAAFIQGLELLNIRLHKLEAVLERAPEGKLHFQLKTTPLGPFSMDGGFEAGLEFELRFLDEDESGDLKPFGKITAEWVGAYRSERKPNKKIFAVFAERNLPVNLWPYFRMQVDLITAQMGLPRLVLPVYKTL